MNAAKGKYFVLIDSLLYRPITIPASARRHERTRNQRSQVQVTFKMSLSASSRKSKTVLQPVEPFLRPHPGGFTVQLQTQLPRPRQAERPSGLAAPR
jgi:hypothetical protein